MALGPGVASRGGGRRCVLEFDDAHADFYRLPPRRPGSRGACELQLTLAGLCPYMLHLRSSSNRLVISRAVCQSSDERNVGSTSSPPAFRDFMSTARIGIG